MERAYLTTVRLTSLPAYFLHWLATDMIDWQLVQVSVWFSCSGHAVSPCSLLTQSCLWALQWLTLNSHEPCSNSYWTILLLNPQILLTVPAVPSSCNICVSYHQLSGRLLFINTTWNTVPVSFIRTKSSCHITEYGNTPYVGYAARKSGSCIKCQNVSASSES